MRVVHYLERIRLEHGGVVRMVLDLVEALDDRGVEVVLATHDPADMPEDWARRSIQVERLAPRLRSTWIPRAERKRIGRLLDGADVAHLHGIWELDSWQFASICRRMGTPYIVSAHGMLDDWCMSQSALKKRVYFRLLGRSRLAHAAAIHLTAEAERDQARQWIPHDRLAVIPLIMNLRPYLEAPKPDMARQAFPALQHGEPVALFLSRIHPKKGVDRLIRASRILLDRGLKHQIVIAGPGSDAYLAEMQQLVSDLELSDVVSFVGSVTGDLKSSLYRAADVFVLPTSQENFGFVFFEALACGTPVVTTTGADTWPSLKASGGAVITDCPPTPEQLADALARFLEDPDHAAELGGRGRAWVSRNMMAEQTTEAFVRLYAETTTPIRENCSDPGPAAAPGQEPEDRPGRGDHTTPYRTNTRDQQ